MTAIGNRPASFYKTLARLPNTILADYRMRGLDLAKHAAVVSTVSGTVAVEATLMGRPAMIFTDNVEYSFLDNVVRVRSIDKVDEALATCLAERTPEQVDALRRQGARYRAALETISFLAPNTPPFRGSGTVMDDAQAERAVDLLIDNFRLQKTIFGEAMPSPTPEDQP